MKFFGCDKGKALREIKAELVAKTTSGAGSGTVGLGGASVKNMLKQIQVLTHARKLMKSPIVNPMEELMWGNCELNCGHSVKLV